MRVLIVDDDVLDRQAARRALLATGMADDIAEAERGSEALELLAGSAFDAVLLDFRLPDADGLEILGALQARKVAVPVIVLTGYGDESVAAALMKAGAADYFAKSRLSADLLALSLRHIARGREVRADAERAEAERERLLLNLAAAQGQTEAILTSMTEGLVVSDLAGMVVAINPAALAMHGFDDPNEMRRPLSELLSVIEFLSLDGAPHTLAEWPLSRAMRGETFSNYEVLVRRRDTGRTWVGSYGGTTARSASGEMILAVVTMRDITAQKTAEARAALLAEAGARLSASLDAQTTLDTVAQLVVPVLADWCAVNVLTEDGAVRPVMIASAGPDGGAVRQALPPAAPLNPSTIYGAGFVLRTGTAQLLPILSPEFWSSPVQSGVLRAELQALGTSSYLCVPLIVRGQVLGALSLASAQVQYDEQTLALATELGQRVAAGLENVRLFQEAQARAEREAMINKIGSALRVSLDGGEILGIVTAQVAQALGADRCRFLRLDTVRGTLEAAPQQYAAAGVPAALGAVPLADWPADIVAAWSVGRSVSLSVAGSDLLACPVFLRGQLGGVLLAEQTRQARSWSRDEEVFLCAVSDLLALALENARMYAREHKVAEILSSAFLSDIPDTLPGLALAANYRAGLEEAQVGGDYYDAFALPDGRVALVIADVSGKGLSAAVQTATVKYSLRAYATEAAAPGLVMTRLNKMLCSELAGLGDHFVTLFYAVFDPASGRLTWTSAGHETMLIKRAAGGSSLLDANGPILGLAEHTYTQEVSVLAPGDSLALYTDGLTEARNSERALLDIGGVQALLEGAPSEAGPGALAAHLQQAALRWTGGRPQDDMALLVVRRMAEALPPETASGPESPPLLSWKTGDDDLFQFHFPSQADYAAEVRQALGHWMATLGYDRAATEDFQTAVTEAVTNAVRHGSPLGAAEEFHIRGRRTAAGALQIEVTDSGLGLPAGRPAPTMPGPEAPGGRGLPLMQQLADSVEFRPAPLGMSVVLVKDLPIS